MKSNVKQEHRGMVTPVHPAQCCRRSGVCCGTSCIHHKPCSSHHVRALPFTTFWDPQRTLCSLLGSLLALAVDCTSRSRSSGSLLLQQHFLCPRKGGIGVVVFYVVWRNAHLCEIYSGGTVKQCICFCMILSKVNSS